MKIYNLLRIANINVILRFYVIINFIDLHNLMFVKVTTSTEKVFPCLNILITLKYTCFLKESEKGFMIFSKCLYNFINNKLM